MLLVTYLAVGAVAGLMAGLFGIGGGMIIVPVLVITFEILEFSPATLTHMAVATSLASIVFTSISSVRTHHQKQAVDWPIVYKLSVGILLGAVLGVLSADALSGSGLQIVIGVSALLMAAQMGLGLKPKPTRSLPATTGMVTAGTGIGWASALFGIGGGSLTVPFLTWCNHPMQRSVATAAACGFPIALVGALTNVFVGWGNEALPQNAVGYVYWPALLGIVITSIPCARLGAKLAHRLSAEKLKRLFAILLVLVAIKFLTGNL
ncbi:sulfite exporter TauE/SafE family protein [Bermanella marisrubri]|uniref:Probable membrane transporter protein n=1 Tax=Bermanella marisrubri TaxID=207949 RepID=Q1MYJ0_9GAMM|nr:sulfite exporter TauE/SafE family protein [Bermanella marisrubri]EAT11041.1 predicted Permease [Oceanobacter sp. RED65] [Bermanella marisrubri]QIZ82973.1 sulfite exporter TauE/SafE family protein [Bermanella marisrubri]